MSAEAEPNPAYFPCPYLGGTVELNAERERHIGEEHSTLIPDHTGYIASVLADPDTIRLKAPPDDTTLFCRRFYDLDKYVVVVVVNHPGPRNWIVTAYVTHRLARGETLWERN